MWIYEHLFYVLPEIILLKYGCYLSVYIFYICQSSIRLTGTAGTLNNLHFLK